MTERDIQDAQWRLRFYSKIRAVRPSNTDARISYWAAERDLAKARGDKRREGEAQREVMFLRHSLMGKAA